MSARETLAQRRKVLLVRGAVQRADLLADAYLLQHAAAPARIGADLLQTVREHKMMIAGAVLAAVVIRPWRLIGMLRHGAAAVQAVRSAAPLLQFFRQRT
ncbi:MAG: hypothetical protein H6R04_965 [Burkholderiaceae bacterium]|nr:hypothetical protein [Burkholderiaceae bacterium]